MKDDEYDDNYANMMSIIKRIRKMSIIEDDDVDENGISMMMMSIMMRIRMTR